MEVYDAVVSRRTIRKFKQRNIPFRVLKQLVNAGRLAPSAANLQPLKFIVVTAAKVREKIFGCLRWAGYISPEWNPAKGQKPVAYIVIINNLEIAAQGHFERDSGAAAQNIILSAWEKDIGSCWLGAIDRKKISEILKIPAAYFVDTVIALGFKDEKPGAVKWGEDCRYYKGKDGELKIPKRAMKEILHRDKF
ncbi:MAG: nitroreductase family protein [Candidatus Aureabacteria bacterium]|nr:nitroreductase family protein [Candidatus Auribacterota bacterium]